MPPDALIFDLDGTLWDTTATCAQAWTSVLARLSIPYRRIDAADVRAVAGKPHLEAVRAVFVDLDEPRIARIAAETEREDNFAVAKHGGAVYPGVLELIPRLHERLPLMIVSNCQRGYIEVFLAATGLGAYFADFECWGNTGAAKAANLRAVSTATACGRLCLSAIRRAIARRLGTAAYVSFTRATVSAR